MYTLHIYIVQCLVYSGIHVYVTYLHSAMFGEQRSNDERGLRLPNHVWPQLETEEQLSEALNGVASHQELREAGEGIDEENLELQGTEYERNLLQDMDDLEKTWVTQKRHG